jgi:hypothetical protein
VADTVILNGQDIGQAQRATSAVFDVVLAEHGTTFDRWVVLNALATGAFPPERARLVPGLAGALATGPAAVEAMLDHAEVAGLARIVSAPGGDPGAVRVELTAAGQAQHGTLRSLSSTWPTSCTRASPKPISRPPTACWSRSPGAPTAG